MIENSVLEALVLQVDIVAWARSHVALVLTGVVALVALAWAYQAYEEAEDSREAVSGFAGRAKDGTGGALNVVLVSLVSVVGWAATTFQTAGEAISFVISLAPEVPVLAASVITVGLGAVGLSDLIVLRTYHFVGISMAILTLAVAYRTDFGEKDL
ncbi:hypothetical protein ACOZ4F_14225 [Haloarcula marismortui]|uniref:hypothetical protein n=1 Tax=Haloarcula marismortui TaxID=2238 RepID=UPI003C7315D3